MPVECPHCASVFQLGTELTGKSMRCPNPDCREVFQVRPVAPASPPPRPREPDPDRTLEMSSPNFTTGGVADFLPVLEVEAVQPAAPAYEFPSGLQHTAIEMPYERVESDAARPMKLEAQPVAEPSVFELPAPDPVPEPSVFELPAPDPVRHPTLNEVPFAPAVAEPVPPKPKKPPVKNVPVAAFAPKAPPLPVAEAIPSKVASWKSAPPPAPLAESIDNLPPPEPVANDADDGVFVRSVKKKSWLPKMIFAALVIGTIAAGSFITFGGFAILERSEKQQAAEAKEAYDAGKFGIAAEKYHKLESDFNTSPDLDEYKFLAALSEARSAADAVTARDEPAVGETKLTEFVAASGDSPYARPDGSHGADIANLGRKVADNLADHGNDRIAKFRADRSKMEHLEAGERVSVEGPKLLASVEKFRGKDTPGFDDQRKKFGDIADAARKERDRLAILAPFRDLAEDPTDESIETCEVTLRRNGLANDAEAKEIVARAKEQLRKLIGSVADVRKAVRVPADLTPPVLFAPTLLGMTPPRGNPDTPPDAVFAVARGILYAFDSTTGEPLWGTRVGGTAGDPRGTDLPVRVTAFDGGPEWVLVVAEENGRRGLAARVARSGEAVWYQPLDFPLAGRPVVVGRRVYVPLADPLGSVAEFQLSTGTKLGQLAVRQPIAGGLAALPGLQSGSGFLFVPADARRVFVFEVGKEADDGNREPPKLVRVIATDHPKDSLRGEPILVSPPSGDGPRYMILPQTDGPAAMKLRSFPLPPPAELAVEGGPAAAGAAVAAPAAEVPVPGWSWFPPASDGERVVAATDAGAVAIFGVNQLGNADKALFALPAPAPAGDPDAVNRALVVSVDEDSAWVIAAGKLTRLRTAVDPTGGLRVISDGKAEVVGEPIHRAQVRPNAGVGVVVTKAGPAAGRATAFDLQTGQIRWQRQLGAVAAGPPVVRAGNTAIIADESGGAYSVPTAEPDSAVLATVLAPPVREPLAPAQVVRNADGSTVWVLVPDTIDGAKRLRVRQIVDGAAKSDTTASLPDLPAGPAVAFGDSLLIPLRDGAVYRLTAGSKLTKGPLWRAGANADAVCFLSAAGPDEFFATDGAAEETGVALWAWSADGRAEKRGATCRGRGAITAPPAVLATGAGLRFAVADSAGVVRVFEPLKQEEHLTQWQGANGGDIPPGSAGGRLDVLTIGGKPRLVYAANRRHLVCLDPEAADPVWVARNLVPDDGPELVGWAVHGDKLLVTDQTARVTAVELETGKQLPDVPVGVTGLAAREVLPVANGRGMLAFADGTAVVIPIPAAK